jgi:hypothetical protein
MIPVICEQRTKTQRIRTSQRGEHPVTSEGSRQQTFPMRSKPKHNVERRTRKAKRPRAEYMNPKFSAMVRATLGHRIINQQNTHQGIEKNKTSQTKIQSDNEDTRLTVFA